MADWRERMDREAREEAAKKAAELALAQADLVRAQKEGDDRKRLSEAELKKYLDEKRRELEIIAKELRIRSIILQIKDVWGQGQTSEDFSNGLSESSNFERGVTKGTVHLQFHLRDSQLRDFHYPAESGFDAYEGGRGPGIPAHIYRKSCNSQFEIALIDSSPSGTHSVTIKDIIPTIPQNSRDVGVDRELFHSISIDGKPSVQVTEEIEEYAYTMTKSRKDQRQLPTDVRKW